MDTLEKLARQAAETINGGEFYDGKWYTEGQREAWRKAMTPAADEIERLRDALKKIKSITSVNWVEDMYKHDTDINEIIKKALGG